jgi:hypothetical protein
MVVFAPGPAKGNPANGLRGTRYWATLMGLISRGCGEKDALDDLRLFDARKPHERRNPFRIAFESGPADVTGLPEVEGG